MAKKKAKKKASKKTSKKTAKKTAKKGGKKGAAAPAEETKPKRTKLSDLPQKEKDAKAHELIDELYGIEDTDDEAQKTKRGIRTKLRNLDSAWRDTYKPYTDENWADEEEEEEE